MGKRLEQEGGWEMSKAYTFTVEGWTCSIVVDSTKTGLAPGSNRCVIQVSGRNPLPGLVTLISVSCTLHLDNGATTVAATSWSAAEGSPVNNPQVALSREDDAQLMGATKISKASAVIGLTVRGTSDPFEAQAYIKQASGKA
jgi:hypothetical protein